MAVGGAEERLHRPVPRLALGLDRERRERHGRRELLAQRARQVRHRVVAGGAARRPLPHLAGAVGGLAALAQRLVRGGPDPSGYGSVRGVIDLRSDTVTKPTPGMLAAMAAAEVGDEQEREDPTTNELQRRMAELLGHEAALFLPTATMANQIALRVLSRPGCEVLAEERTHVLIYEWGGPAIHSGPRHARARRRGGQGRRRSRSSRRRRVRRRAACSCSRTRTAAPAAASGRSTSSAPPSTRRATRGAAVHLDGARLFNASVAAGVEPLRLGSARRLRHDLLLEGARLPVRRRPRRLGRD